jgi:hypothetical protein
MTVKTAAPPAHSKMQAYSEIVPLNFLKITFGYRLESWVDSR